MRRLASKDILSGAFFILLGTGMLIETRSYEIGSALRMGPGFFPTAVGGLLVAVGLMVFLTALRNPGEQVRSFAWWPLILVLASIIAFALTLERLGLIAAVAILVVASSVVIRPFSWRTVIGLVVGLIIVSVVLFWYFLGLPLELGF